MQPQTPQALQAAVIEQAQRALTMQQTSLDAWKKIVDAGVAAQRQVLDALTPTSASADEA